jgi:hypothetical protein
MSSKPLIWLGLAVGSALGGAIPLWWSAGPFSLSGLVFSSAGALIGLYIGFKANESLS